MFATKPAARVFGRVGARRGKREVGREFGNDIKRDREHTSSFPWRLSSSSFLSARIPSLPLPSPADIGKGNCHPHSGEEVRVLAPQRLKRLALGAVLDDNLDLTSSAPAPCHPIWWRPVAITLASTEPQGRVQNHTRIKSLAPFAPCTPSRSHVVAECRLPPIRLVVGSFLGTAVTVMQCSGSPPTSRRQISPDLGGYPHVSLHQWVPSMRWTMRAWD
jgi:hypothetical protein